MAEQIIIEVDIQNVSDWLDAVKQGNQIMTKIADSCKSDSDKIAVYQDYIQQYVSNEFMKIIVSQQVAAAKEATPTLVSPFDDRIEVAKGELQDELKTQAETAAKIDQTNPPDPVPDPLIPDVPVDPVGA